MRRGTVNRLTVGTARKPLRYTVRADVSILGGWAHGPDIVFTLEPLKLIMGMSLWAQTGCLVLHPGNLLHVADITTELPNQRTLEHSLPPAGLSLKG